MVAQAFSAEDPLLGKFHGLARSLVANAVRGVTEGFKKELDIVGVGYRAELKGKQVHFALGYSHPVPIKAPEGIEFEVPQPTRIIVKGSSKQQVGQIAGNRSSFDVRNYGFSSLSAMFRNLLEQPRESPLAASSPSAAPSLHTTAPALDPTAGAGAGSPPRSDAPGAARWSRASSASRSTARWITTTPSRR